MLRFSLVGAALIVAGCASQTGSNPQSSAPISASTTVLPGNIAQCGFEGAPVAGIPQSAEWTARLARVIDGAPTDELLGGPPVTAVIETDRKPVSIPSPILRPADAPSGAEAICETLMDVSQSGAPKDVLVSCSRAAFEPAALEASKKLRFAPKSEDGRLVEVWNVIYPYTFCVGR